MSSDAAHAPAAAAEPPMTQVGQEHHHHYHHHAEDAPAPTWSIHPGRPKKSKHHKHARAPRPYKDDPSSPGPGLIYADASDAESQTLSPRPHVLRDVLVIIFQLILLLAMGLIAYRWYTDFCQQWRATHADQIAAEVQRREHILKARALQEGSNAS